MESSYTITERNGCRLVRGAVPAASFGMLTHGMPDNAVLDPHAARLLGVTFAIGTPDALAELIADPEVLSAAQRKADAHGAGLSDAARKWMATGEHGMSSMTIFQRLTGVRMTQWESPPSDPSDLMRCRKLLEFVPELQARFAEMAAVSPVWASLVDQWADLCALMDAEAPEWRNGRGRATQTYERMKEIGC